MGADIWLKAVKWTALVAAVIAVIAVPVVWHKKEVEAAFKLGKMAGATEVIADLQMKEQEKLREMNAVIAAEAKRAQAAIAKAEKFRREADQKGKELEEALKKHPESGDCFINDNATSILRDFATGNFRSEGASVSGSLDPKVPLDSPFPGDPRNDVVRPSGGVHEGSERVFRVRYAP